MTINVLPFMNFLAAVGFLEANEKSKAERRAKKEAEERANRPHRFVESETWPGWKQATRDY